jgi:thioesterase domain-containing protein
LYCVHSASGSAYSYLPLLPLLDAERPLYGLEAPGFDDDSEEPLTDVADLSALYLRAIAQDRPGEPIGLLGWSLGGVIAYDMASRLLAAGTPAVALIAVDTGVPAPGEPPGRRSMLRRFVSDLTGAPPLESQLELDRALADQPEEVSIEHTFGALIDAGLISDHLDIETLAHRFAVFRANVCALHRYSPTGSYPGPMITIRAAESSPEEMDWSGLAADWVEHTVPGDHYSIWQGEGLRALAEIIERSLDECMPAR